MIPVGSSEIQEGTKSNGKHISSDQHRYLTTQSRQWMGTTSLMDRFLQDVLRHHPYHYQESRSMQNERLHMTTVSPSGVVPNDDFVPEIMTEDATGVREEMSSKAFEPVEELYSRPSKSQEYIQSVSIRPSVIQKLEKGQQQPLEFIHKIGSRMKEFNPVGIGHATNNRQNVIYSSVISNAPVSCLPESSHERPVTTNATTGLPLGSHLDSVNKCDPNKVDKYFKQLDRSSTNPMLSSHPETSSVTYQKPKESNRKSLCINSDKLVIQEDVKSQGKTLSTGSKVHEFVGAEGFLKLESLSRFTVNPAVNLNKTDMPSNKGNFEDGIPKHHEKFFPNMDHTQEGKHLVFNKSAFLEQKISVSSEMKFAGGCLQSASDHHEEAVPDLWKEEQIDQEVKNCESRGSEMSFDGSSSFYSLTDQSKVTAKEINLLKEVHADLEYKNNKSCVSEISSECDGSLQLTSNQTQVIVKDVSVQKAMHIRLVDESYDSSDSEMNFDCDASLQSTDNYPQQPEKEVNLPKGAHVGLVDMNYGSSSSEISAGSVFSPQSVVDQFPVAVTETKLRKKVHISLVDKNYGSTCSETSFDCDVSLQSVVDHPQLAVKERNLEDRLVYLEDKNHKPSSAKTHLDCDVSLQTMTDEPQRAVEEIYLLKEKNDVDMNCGSHGPEMNFHLMKTDAKLVPDQSQVAVKEVNAQEVALDLENKSVKSSISDLSFDSHASLYRSANDQPQGACGEINLKALNVDMEVKSYGCSSSELSFDSDPPLMSVTEYTELDVEEIRKKYINLEDESFESISSKITFDSDIPLHSVADQSQVAIYEEESIDLGNKSNESCVSEITFDSDIPLHSGIYQPEVAAKETFIQKEEHIHLGGKDDEPSSSEISLDSYIPFHSVINHPEGAVKKLNSQKEEWAPLENKENEPCGSELSFDVFRSMTGCSEDPIKERNLLKEEIIRLESKEHVNLADKGNELSVFETSLDSDIPLQSVIHKSEVVVKERWLQKEKHAKLKGKSAKFSGSEINLDSDYSMAEPQIAGKEIDVQKEERVFLENRSDKYSGSEIILDSDVPLQSMNDQPRLALLKEKHVDLEDTNNESSDGKIAFHSDDPLQPLTEQFQEVVEKTNLWKEEDMGQKNKVDEPNASKLIYNSDVSLLSVSDQPEVAVKQINLKNEGHVYLEDKNSQYSGSEMSLNSDLLVQSIVDHPQITILEQEHTELEDKHNQSCGSEISFDSDDRLQSVANQLRETVKEVSLWKDEVDMEDKRDESKCFEIVYDSDVLFQSVAGQTKVVKEINLREEDVDSQDKVVKPSDSKINFVSDEPLQSVANEIQEAITEINLREGHVCLGTKSYEPNDSEVIYVSNAHLQSVVEQPHILEEQQASLEDKSNDPCGPEISFVSDDPLQLVTGQLQKAVEEIGLWEEDHVYLEDKRYKLGDFEVSYDSDVDFIAGHSPVAVKEINLQEKDHDLHKNCELSVSEIKCDSGVHLRLEVDQPQMVCKEVNLQMEKHLGMEERVSEPSDSEIMCDSDVPLQIVINELQVSDKETDLQKMLFVDLMTSDNDCEIISDSDVPFQPVIDSPQMTVNEISCINAESVVPEDENCDSCDSELGYVCEASPQSVTDHSKKTFKVVNQKQDYIILEETSCEPYISELNFQIDASHQSMTSQSQEPGKKKAKYIDPEDKICQSNRPKRNFEREETSQPVTQQRQKANKGVNLWKDVENIGLKDKNCQSSVSAMDCNESPELVIHQMSDKENLLQLKRTNLESMSCEPCGSGMNFQCDPSLQSDNDQPQEAVNKIDLFEKMSFDLKETNHNSHSGSVPMVDSIRNLEKAKEVTEDDPDEPVLEGLPHVPPSFVGKTWSQIMREGDVKIDALVKEFKKGRFHCYFDDDCETRKIKKKKSNEGKKITWTDLNQDTTSIQVLSDCDDNAGGISDIGDFSVALDKPSHYPSAKKHLEQTCRVASPCQAIKVSHGTQTNLASHPGTKRRITGQEKDSPVRKRSLLQNDRKTRKKVKIGKVEFPESCITVLKPLQPNALIYVLSSNIKLKKGESNNFSKRRHGSRNNWDLSIQYKFNQSSFNCYDPLNKQIVIDPSLNIEVPGPDRNNCVEIHFSHLNSNAGDDDTYVQSSASAPFMTVSVGHELMAHQEANESVFLEKSKILNSSEVSKESNFQSTLLNHDVAKISLKSIRNKFLESKRKIQRRKVTTNNKPGFPKEGSRPVIPQQKTRIASEKRSIWIQTKLSDIIKKYIPKYSVFLRHKYRSRSTFVRMHLKKKKSDVSRLKKAKRPAKILSNASVPSAGAEEQSRAIASSSPKQPVRGSSAVAGSKKNGNKKRPRRQQRKPSRPVRTYALRSLYSGIPCSDRMRTRLSDKL
ncbi:DBF4-type zinc finger-containing protein 2 isoform X2 [Mesoplodon densirostris]|uniref:DBF4-type zinc finger-containing protein 2 isoform X2 n=1 Tax=Mesoplodon densirostris TaxID=48708 RepID=UPI0028DC10B2|nr:DBF4-type zinc finger-containing protein 2 isoform X2 [Mesoplodon densirostris]